MSRPSIVPLGIALLLAFGSLDVMAQKLYRWVDSEGKVHYSDSVPPEAVDREREMLNKRGRAVERVDRALTAEERAEQAERLAAEAAAAKAREEQAKLDAVLLGSYHSEVELTRAYTERFDLVEQTLESARIGIRSQEKSLLDLLDHAANIERSGKAPGERVDTSIVTARRQVVQQRAFLAKREAERVALRQEFEQTMARFRELKSQKS
jgi:hypothetical protein